MKRNLHFNLRSDCCASGFAKDTHMRTPVICGNWKMDKDAAGATSFFESFLDACRVRGKFRDRNLPLLP
jgi:hypothetical protein